MNVTCAKCGARYYLLGSLPRCPHCGSQETAHTPGRSLTNIFADARARMEMEAGRGADWTYMYMTEAERDAFDRWLVSISHVLAQEAGTTERRFKLFMSDLISGRYKGEMP